MIGYNSNWNVGIWECWNVLLRGYVSGGQDGERQIAGKGGGTRLRACGAEACAAPNYCIFSPIIPKFHHSFIPLLVTNPFVRVRQLPDRAGALTYN